MHAASNTLSTVRAPAALVALLATSAVAAPATAGTIEIRGEVSEVLTVSAVAFANHNGTAAELGDGSSRIQFGVGWIDPQKPLGGTLTLAMRSNVPYALSLAAHSEDGAPLSEVRVGVHSLSRAGDGARTHPAALAASEIAEGFAGDPLQPGGAATNATLADLATAVPVARGPAISAGGTLASDNNALLVDVSLAARPELLRRHGAFSVVLSYTMASP